MASDHPGGPAPSVRACTIAAANYLPRVRVLAESWRRHADAGDLCVMLVDDPDGTTDDTNEPFRVLSLDELGIDPVAFARMTLYYSVTELATAVKPWVLAGLAAGVAGAADAVAYLDPDTELFAPLDDLWALAADGNVVLTPHALAPFPRDDRRIREHSLLESGVFNLGFIAVPATGVGPAVLDWWAERLRYDAIVDHHGALFTDQKWMDLAPTLFPVTVVRDPGVNVAYWNLHERPITHDGTRWLAGGVPLRLFHFSGFDPARPHLVSSHQGATPRIVRSASPELGRLLDGYADALTAAGHPGDQAGPPYRWGHLPNGLRLTATLRRLYRTALMAHDLGVPTTESRPPDPVGPGWLARYMDWLCEPVLPRMLPRHVQSLLATRNDVADAFADCGPADFARGLSDWLATSGIEEEGMTASFALRLGTELEQWATAMACATTRRGVPDTECVNVIGFLSSVNGLASGARQLVGSLDAAGLANRVLSMVHPNPRVAIDSPTDVDLFGVGTPADGADITVACVNADVLDYIGPIPRWRLFGDSYRVGYWWWEVDLLPSGQSQASSLVDELWVGTTHVADLLRPLVDVPVHRVPLPVRTPQPAPLDRAGLGIGEHDMVFSYVFDHSSVLGRKNPLGVIDAYCEAFGPGDGTTLVIKTLNDADHPVDAELLRHAAARRADVVLVEQRLPLAQLDGLVAESAAYVSLHRSEGLGLTILDACLLGVPVIASAQGGCMDFLAADSSWLVPVTTVAVGPGNDPYPAAATWGEPDLDVAVRHLRAVATDPAAARATAAVAGDRARDTYHADVCRDLITDRVHRIRRMLADQRLVATP